MQKHIKKGTAMDIRQIMEELNQMFLSGKTQEIEAFLEEKCKEAGERGEFDVLPVLYNEMIGLYRETGQYDKSIGYCHDAIELLEGLGYEDTVPFATTLLNVANAHRAAGLLEESYLYYQRVFPIYSAKLEPDDVYFASLYNNLSLLYQEKQEFDKAKEQLLKALDIVKKKENMAFEVAVTYANLANTCIALDENDIAIEYANEAVRIFEEINVDDAHYSAAVAALGGLYYKKAEYEQAIEMFEKSRNCVEKYLGTENTQYQRLTENIEYIQELMRGKDVSDIMNQTQEHDTDMEKWISGIQLCRSYYEAYGKPMIETQFPDYKDKIAVGLVGKGSDCFGFDDEYSRDHDYGPRFVMWVTAKTYEEIGEALQQAYEKLPTSYQGVERIETFHGRDRAGVMAIEEFYKKLLGADLFDNPSIQDWLEVEEYALAAATNGEVFTDAEGIFTSYRNKLKAYYPKAVWYRRLAQAAALFSQNGQYNMPRMLKRGQFVAAELAKAECMKQAMKLQYLLNHQYAPHDKWLYKGLELQAAKEQTVNGQQLCGLIEQLSGIAVLPDTADYLMTVVEAIAQIFAEYLTTENIVEAANPYLDANTQEMIFRSDALIQAGDIMQMHATQMLAPNDRTAIIEALALEITKAEFEAFDKVQNEGGRASCQNNWHTFKIMRMSQYKTWTEDMLMQYLYEFKTNLAIGRNMIEEKYARMMESTAPEKYAEFADRLPEISQEKRAIMEEIIRLQVSWMEEFAAKYPKLADNARFIHTSEDMPYDTSYETYLRGELGTYSDKMLALYGRYVVACATAGENLAQKIMGNTIEYYGYLNFEEAQEGYPEML
ncbi:MAG: DUF4125 family protein [Lachnospiraceae bacterium]|nr:DUF4125 family protein [Lachnospiraceae bacterium]